MPTLTEKDPTSACCASTCCGSDVAATATAPATASDTVTQTADAHAYLGDTGLDADRIASEVGGRTGAAFVRATKPLVK